MSARESLFSDVPIDGGVSPCFVNCGEPACLKLGCVRVYNARNRCLCYEAGRNPECPLHGSYAGRRPE